MHNIVDYIKKPLQMGKKEEDTLSLLIEKYPYFHTLHILLAKSQKNQHAFTYPKSLKSASLYAGDRKILYRFIEDKREESTETRSPVFHSQSVEPSSPNVSIEKPEVNEDTTKIETESRNSLSINSKEVENFEPEPIIEPVIIEQANDTLFEAEETSEVPVKEETELKTDADPQPETKDVQEEKINPVADTNARELEVSGSDVNPIEEQDFFSWLDKFKIETPQPIKENSEIEQSQLTNDVIEEETAVQHDILEEIKTSDGPVVYDPAGWAEIAYDIQAFVKHKDPEPEEEKTPKGQTKEEIDAILDRFIKKNPSISRTKTEFYKPENMARKSEEFHGEVASETLASLFYRQGHLHKSLELYEKLILQNPDKKEIFAARIKSIKEELINRL